MKTLLVMIAAITLVSCDGPDRVNESTSRWGIQVLTRDESGNQHWLCMAVEGGGSGNAATPAELKTWEPNSQGKCFKPVESK